MDSRAEGIASLLRTTRLNAALGWLLTGVIAMIVGGNVLLGNVLWAGFAAVVGGLAVLPPLAQGDPMAMIPWEVFVLAALPLLGNTFGVSLAFRGIPTYLSVAALALIVAVELHLFTDVEMNYQFALLFVVVSTLALAGLWAVARWLSDLYLGTTLLVDPAIAESVIEEQLMWEFVASAVAGVLAGLTFELYVRRYVHVRPGGD
ncbi:hypothetical protein Hrd1104_05070 [Halorhabdus sp. CBA1104]|uniref:hypothetical protein n=1 Tax=unclassified Halorhabdus TaxID=2621901 RepID=UPI0012B287A0|nr:MULTISPECIES: hypothetical protein [unclassified Halorhabdus]QGN06724.1 hypothetical protein Hrd1104_05070 [Halorhabdus sp. CBA1104]